MQYRPSDRDLARDVFDFDDQPRQPEERLLLVSDELCAHLDTREPLHKFRRDEYEAGGYFRHPLCHSPKLAHSEIPDQGAS